MAKTRKSAGNPQRPATSKSAATSAATSIPILPVVAAAVLLAAVTVPFLTDVSELAALFDERITTQTEAPEDSPPHHLITAPLAISPYKWRKGEKFLLFDAARQEQFNKQRRTIMYYLQQAMQSGKTIVLPRFRMLRPERFLPYSHFFNLSTVRQNVFPNALEIDEYFAERGKYIDELVEYVPGYMAKGQSMRRDPSKAKKKVERETGCPQSIIDSLKISRATWRRDGEKSLSGFHMTFNGIPDVFVKKLVCAGGSTGGISHTAPVSAYSNAINQIGVSTHFRGNEYLNFRSEFHAAAERYVQKYVRHPFLAVHWRRTDFIQLRRTREGVLYSHTELAEKLKKTLEKYNLKKVYLATDSTETSALSYLRTHLQLVPPFSDTLSDSQRDGYDPQEIAVVEQMIAVQAKQFLGTETSLYTATIIEERTLAGHKPSTSKKLNEI